MKFPAKITHRGPHSRLAWALGLKMQPTRDQHEAFLSREPLAGVAFMHNDHVHVIAGEHEGISGSLVSIEALGVDPIYLVELESNQDAFIAQSFLQRDEA